MAWQQQLDEVRKQIDEVDAALVPLFCRRMEMAAEVARVKCEGNLAVKDTGREQQVVDRAMALSPEEFRSETALMMRTMMALSREYQHRLLFSAKTPLLPEARQPLAGEVCCTYQGVPGAWSEEAAATLFPAAEKQACEHFEDVFLAVKRGEAGYGVVPIENSKTGAIGETYDLLRKYGCYIVGKVSIPIRQCLVGKPGTRLSDIREVLSHPEGLRQCSRFLKDRPWDLTAQRNTAVAAKKVAETEGNRVAAIASRRAAALYGLEVLAADVMDAADNRTAFVVIAAQPEYNEKSDLISVTFSTQHRSGALCEALLPFMADGLNLMRIESRPAAADKYRFFAEIQGNIMDDKVRSALRQAAGASEYFEVLGCYSCTRPEEEV